MSEESKTPISNKHAGLVVSHRYLGGMFNDMVSLETQLTEANARVKELEIESGKRLGAIQILTATIERSKAKMAQERERVRVLREALEFLYAEQNGAPLHKWEHRWNAAMTAADEALSATAAPLVDQSTEK